MISAKESLGLLSRTYTEWSNHQAPRLGASVAFYSILSFAPLIVLVTAIIGLVFGHESAQGALVNQARQFIGERGADTVHTLLKNAQKPASGTFASIAAFITLLFGASGVFSELQDALNLMWDVKGQHYAGFMGMVKQRLFSFGMVLSVGFLLLVSLLLSTALAFIGHSFQQLVPMPPAVLQVINFIVSFAVVTTLFALMFKYVPDAHISWKDVRIGAVGTALLFTIGKLLLGLYLGKAGVGSTYGAAGSLVAVVVWIYYSAQIFFFGAEFTHLYSQRGHVASAAPDSKPAAAAAMPKQESRPEPVTAPLAMAAAAGAPSPTPALNPAPYVPKLEAVLPAPPQAVHQHREIETPVRRHTKPELLTSLAVGFVLGRLSGRVQKRQELPQS